MTGLVSWGTGCGDENSPGVYTDVSQHREWMTKHLGEADYLEIAAKTTGTVSNQSSTELTSPSLSTDSMITYHESEIPESGFQNLVMSMPLM